MSCLLVFLATCVFDPSQVYVTASVQTDLRRADYAFISYCGHQEGWCHGPVGEIRLGVQTPISRSLTLDYGVGHKSYIMSTRDQGAEFAFASLTWRPFR